jgi:hypothetical protein
MDAFESDTPVWPVMYVFPIVTPLSVTSPAVRCSKHAKVRVRWRRRSQNNPRARSTQSTYGRAVLSARDFQRCEHPVPPHTYLGLTIRCHRSCACGDCFALIVLCFKFGTHPCSIHSASWHGLDSCALVAHIAVFPLAYDTPTYLTLVHTLKHTQGYMRTRGPVSWYLRVNSTPMTTSTCMKLASIKATNMFCTIVGVSLRQQRKS